LKAVIYRNYGLPEVLQVEEVDRPEHQPDEVLIRVHATEVTKADCELRSFNFPVKWFWLPLRLGMGVRRPRRNILGTYFSGQIEAVGDLVKSYHPGQQVMGCAGLRMGAYGEYVCLPESYTMVSKPNNMSHEEAASVPLGGLNALHFMDKAKIQKGDRVLVNGAGGSIGMFAVQIAKGRGAHVTAVDAPYKESMLSALGIDEFIDYTAQSFHELEQKWDVIFDMVVSSSYPKCLQQLNPGGRYLLGNPRGINILRSFWTSLTTDKTVTVSLAKESYEELQTLVEMIEKDELRTVIDSVISMEQMVEAHHRVEQEERVGAVVLSCGPTSP